MELRRVTCLAFELLLVCALAGAMSCAPCDREECGDLPTCGGGLVPDPCECCYVCAKLDGEDCGGPFGSNGQCDMNLSCIISPAPGQLVTDNEKGVCKPAHSLKSTDVCQFSLYDGCDIVNGDCECKRVKTCYNPHRFQNVHQCQLFIAKEEELERDCPKRGCSLQPSPTCPDDSTLQEGYIPRGACCPLPSRCVCNPDSCGAQLCHPSTRRVLVKTGSNLPGACCNVYDCVPIDDDEICASVKCPDTPKSACPPDSVAVPAEKPRNKCCPPPPTCQCNRAGCKIPNCSGVQRPQVAFRGDGKPGSCCDVYTCSSEAVNAGCSVNGTRHKHGTTYEREGCRSCECRNGVSLCTPRPCPALSCSRQIRKADECCPVCQDGDAIDDFPGSPIYNPRPMCSSDDGTKLYDVGNTWNVDNCTVCVCGEGGKKRCNAAHCQETIITITAPVCPSLDDCTLECPHGYLVDAQNCRVCACVKTLCPSLSHCKSHCPGGYKRDSDGCPTCHCQVTRAGTGTGNCQKLDCVKDCPYGYRKQRNGCDRCRCKRCPSTDQCQKQCKFGLDHDMFGCTICKCKASRNSSTISVGGKSCRDPEVRKRRDDGEVWSSGCYFCLCRGGRVMCDLLLCPVLRCSNPVATDGACCPSCPEDVSESTTQLIPHSLSCVLPSGGRLLEGETVVGASCVTCTCNNGALYCSSVRCPKAPVCDSPVIVEGSCCPVCPGKPRTVHGIKACRTPANDVIKSGVTWQKDACTNCVCENGDFRCVDRTCPTMEHCDEPVLRHGECCSSCLATNSTTIGFGIRKACRDASGLVYRDGSTWHGEGCERCACADGQLSCAPKRCPTTPPCHGGLLVASDDGCCTVCKPADGGMGAGQEDNPLLVEPNAAESRWTEIAIGVGVLVLILAAGLVAAFFLRRRCTRHVNGRMKDFGDDSSRPLSSPKRTSRLTSSSKLLSTSSEGGDKPVQV